MDSQGDLRKRFKEVRKEASSTRSSLYHLTKDGLNNPPNPRDFAA